MKVIAYVVPGQRRSETIAHSIAAGFKAHGIVCRIEPKYSGVEADLAVAYGWSHQPVFDAYRRRGAHYCYVDLGFWERKPETAKFGGYHKIVFDNWCPADGLRRGMPGDRLERLGVRVRSERTPGGHVIVAGMSEKSALHHGFDSEAWERAAIVRMRANTLLPIFYRPKPSWRGARPIEGSMFSTEGTIDGALAGAHALVTHHSNAAVDAIAAGVPVHCVTGVGKLLSTVNLDDVASARAPSEAERTALLRDIAYIQWTPAEMASGEFWDHYRGAVG